MEGSACNVLWPLIKIVRYGIIPIIEIGIPIILIVLGIFDLAKAVMASKEDEIKSAQKLLVKRIIYGVAIFFVTLIVTIVFNLVASVSTDDSTASAANWKMCWNCKYTVRMPSGEEMCYSECVKSYSGYGFDPEAKCAEFKK